MQKIAFIDTEVNPSNKRILDIGCIKENNDFFRSSHIAGLAHFLKDTVFLCGHNIIHHDLQYIKTVVEEAGISKANIIDTLYLSPLLFPARPYHALVKDDKLQTEELNNPVSDSIKAKDLFFDEVSAFGQLPEYLRQIYYSLLKDCPEFCGFFNYTSYHSQQEYPGHLILQEFQNHICHRANLEKLIADSPVELAYCLSLIHSNDRNSITPPWVLKQFPGVERIMFLLKNNPCIQGCDYCHAELDIFKGLKKYFGYDSYRTFDGVALQEQAVKAAISDQSLLAVFPTGGGKSITFQVPALMSGNSVRGLTVIISPLQSLMKDQVDNLEKKGITDSVTINGLLDPIERAKSYERVEDGSASILYISPESLRSKSIERLLLNRNVVRFVIDEAHCFSSWGQDFRVDYLYIGDFIRELQKKKNREFPIPVSCFTATAKQKVIEDICAYFQEKLGITLQLFTSTASRTNLTYQVLSPKDETDKYQMLRNLIEAKNCPTIVYVSRTKKAEDIASQLKEDGFLALPYHGKMEAQKKSENQNAFISGEVSVMVATSAFGMGVDKPDVGMVIHYEISDSLENYVQEAGRAGRDENIEAECFVLFNEDDLNRHFVLLNQTRLNINEIQQIWKAIKEITRFRSMVSNSALEIARKAGWDENIREIETRVTTAIAALEEAGYLKRGHNMPRVFANSILSKNAQEAIDKINLSENLDETQKMHATRIIKKLISTKSRAEAGTEVAESRVDYIADHLGLRKETVIGIINILREEQILADTKDLTAYVDKGDTPKRSLGIFTQMAAVEKFLFEALDETEYIYNLKELNQNAENRGVESVSVQRIKTILNFWAIIKWIRRQKTNSSPNHMAVVFIHTKEVLRQKLKKRQTIARFFIEYLYQKIQVNGNSEDAGMDVVLTEFSVHELKAAWENQPDLFSEKITIEEVEDTLFYLSRIGAMKIEGGFLVLYNRLTIERTEQDNKKRYKAEDYEKLDQFYKNKTQQIHIVGEYAKKMIEDYQSALQFVEDYFQLNYSSFLRKYFPGSKEKEITRPLTPAKFRRIFGELSPKQLNIINDNDSQYMVVAAGPGSGKTRILVHKLASLLLMEEVKHEQLLMITFSRAAATEFKTRLYDLIGNAARFIEIRTFHSYCFDLLGKPGSLEKSSTIIREAVEKIRNGQVEQGRITKTVVVIDEAQDMSEEEFQLILALTERNDDMKIIAVGDDDQNIFEFRKSSSKYMHYFINEKNATKHELVENFRSRHNLVEFANVFAEKIPNRLKTLPIVAQSHQNGTLAVVRYKSEEIITPLVKAVIDAPLSGSTCIITPTNGDVLQITGILLSQGIPAKQIQTNEGFSLRDLREIRYFLQIIDDKISTPTISEDRWEFAKRKLKDVFYRSSRYELCHNLIRKFEAENPKVRYRSELESFVLESREEDFHEQTSEKILVSTIHMTKGKEFDNVFLMLRNFAFKADEDFRKVYVALTRAKTNLSIHLNGHIFDQIQIDNLEKTYDNTDYLPPDTLIIQLTHKDLWLDYFYSNTHVVKNLVSGDILKVTPQGCVDEKGEIVLNFSQHFKDQINQLTGSGFLPVEAKVNYIVYWKKKGIDTETMVVLPEIAFQRVDKKILLPPPIIQ
ncbi:MAG: RecQ family ATP-dependent DNA helicase [Bacteroidia bacterium]